jgi:hypothetical protein
MTAVSGHSFNIGPYGKTCLLYWQTGFRGEDFKTFSPIGSYAKTMSAEGDHLGWRSGSQDTFLKIDHLDIVLTYIVEPHGI